MSWLFSKALVEAYENSRFSQALVEAFSRANCLAGDASAPWNTTPMPQAFWSPDRTIERCDLSRYGMTSARLTADRSAAVLTWFLAGFRARSSAPQLEDGLLQTISGRSSSGWWQMSFLERSRAKTSPARQSIGQRKTSSRWVTRPTALPLARQTWVVTTCGTGTGFVHTPTCTANYAAPSMQKWPSCRSFVHAFGKPTPTNHEWLMGWPIGWTASEPLETAKFQQWQQQHGAFSAADERKAA
jgi:hypothetical protein